MEWIHYSESENLCMYTFDKTVGP